MEKIKTYCSNCCKETIHVIWTEDGYGASDAARIFTTIISLGMSNIDCTTYSKCINCGKIKKYN